MAEQIKTITEREQFPELFYRYFSTGDVYLKTKSGDLRIKFQGYSEGLVAFRIPYLKNLYENCLIFTRFEDYVIYAQLKLAEKQEEDLYVFSPLKIQMIYVTRREGRVNLDAQGGKSILYVTGIISDFIIENSLAMEIKKVDKVKEMLKYDMQKRFNHIKIYFLNEGMSDPRMKHFYETKMPIFIPDLKRNPTEKEQKDYNFFINNIYSKDYYLNNRKGLVSEVSVPVLYKAKIPYGYIQVNNEAALTETTLTLIKRMAIVVEELFAKYKIFPQTEEKLLVSDISPKGLGIVFKERRFIRYFKEKSAVFFDLILPQNKKASVQAIVRNIALLENKIIKVGCEFKEMDAISEVNYDEYLESIGLSE